MLRRRSGVSIVLIATAAALLAPAAVPSPALVVTTTNGAVGGIVEGAVKEWRGVPYAAPPIGPLRWRAPATVTPWAGVRDATSFATPCIQLDFANGGTLGSEDCLYLNVFVPATATSTSHLPVMVHLHPGGNSTGDAYTEADAFTARGVVVVTVGYRLGVLGFVAHPALTAEGSGSSGTYGLLDQIAALQWVHQNIDAFGGDSSRVTLFGSSAGSFDTVAVMASPRSRGLISAAAVQGEPVWPLTGRFNTLVDSEALGLDVLRPAGCDAAADVLACLRATPASQLVEGAGYLDIGPPVDGTVLPKAPLELVREGGMVPLLVGFDREEDAAFHQDAFQGTYTKTRWVKDTNSVVGPNLGERVRALYPVASYPSLLWSFLTIATDAVRGCPTRRLANAVSASGAPVWRYLYTHAYENDPFFGQFRASHVLEEALLWHADVLGFGHTLTPAEETLSARMTSYWANFALTGDPNGADLPRWPQYSNGGEQTLTLDDQVGVVSGYHAAQCAVLDTLPAPFPGPFELGGRSGPPSVPPAFLYGRARAFS